MSIMRRMCIATLALALALGPAVWARSRAAYPGWAGELALRAAGCQAVSARLSGWAALRDCADAAAAGALAGRVASALDIVAQPVMTDQSVTLTGVRPGVAATLQARQSGGQWLLAAELTCVGGGALWYRRLNAALDKVGYRGRTHVTVLGTKSGHLAKRAETLAVSALCCGLLGEVATTVSDGRSGTVLSGHAGLIPRQAGATESGGSFALSFHYDESVRTTVISIAIPGLR